MGPLLSKPMALGRVGPRLVPAHTNHGVHARMDLMRLKAARMAQGGLVLRLIVRFARVTKADREARQEPPGSCKRFTTMPLPRKIGHLLLSRRPLRDAASGTMIQLSPDESHQPAHRHGGMAVVRSAVLMAIADESWLALTSPSCWRLARPLHASPLGKMQLNHRPPLANQHIHS